MKVYMRCFEYPIYYIKTKRVNHPINNERFNIIFISCYILIYNSNINKLVLRMAYVVTEAFKNGL